MRMLFAFSMKNLAEQKRASFYKNITCTMILETV